MAEFMTASGKKMPGWLEERIKTSIYQRIAERYYREYNPSNHLYIEVEKDGTIRAYDGWAYKKGITNGVSGLEKAEFERIIDPSIDWRAELASAILFARRARKQYGWNIVPVFDGCEIEVKTN
jgi:hypothetical protein